ncbi:fibritin neck whiskers [Salmonella phage STP4-a]|uniref:Fibritin neck whiskers n=1 Tax=Salmonella phage STP4-a TaxID=1445860 RepID=A0A0B4L9F2_9CAUD|nr:fibritin neck whisker [Salmonella phage STP4-a]AHJ87002.1 fibritin neck whiskers [Salmonella phage STP4-a]
MELKPLPFVNGLPEEGQQRINWIKNGEELGAASTKFGTDGELNRGPNQVQSNVVVIDENVRKLAEASTEMSAQISTINSVLEVSGNTEALSQIGKNTTDIGLLKQSTTTIQDGVLELDTRVSFIEEDVGVFNPSLDTLQRPIRDDLYWIKKEMGQYPGQDINGQAVTGNEATGMKRRIINNSSAINNNNERLSKLEKSFSDSDVGSLTSEVTSIREELGPKPTGTIDPIYSRLTKMNGSIGGLAINMEDVMDSIGYNSGVTSIIGLVNTNTSDIVSINGKLSNSTTGVIPRLDIVEAKIGDDASTNSINGRIKTNTNSINNLNQIVGADTSSGLRGQVAWINQTVGIVPSGSSPSPTSVIYRVDHLETQQDATNSSIQDLQIEIGNNTEGLKGQVIRLNTTINGTSSGGTVEQKGLLPTVKEHEESINKINLDMQNLIPEAPMDGKAYVRRDGAWVDITTLTP